MKKRTKQNQLDNFIPAVGFNGELIDNASKGYLLGCGYRRYDPSLGRFNSKDSESPFGSGGLSSYSYCAGNPITSVDPTGHSFMDFLVGITNIIIGVAGIIAAPFTGGSSVVIAAGMASGLTLAGAGIARTVAGAQDAAGHESQVARAASFWLGAASAAFGVVSIGKQISSVSRAGKKPYRIERKLRLRAKKNTNSKMVSVNADKFKPNKDTSYHLAFQKFTKNAKALRKNNQTTRLESYASSHGGTPLPNGTSLTGGERLSAINTPTFQEFFASVSKGTLGRKPGFFSVREKTYAWKGHLTKTRIPMKEGGFLSRFRTLNYGELTGSVTSTFQGVVSSIIFAQAEMAPAETAPAETSSTQVSQIYRSAFIRQSAFIYGH
ncbi:RHS repeat-associated core domain-containing protein [Zooshikella sp. RANM57]|uniref:RHS repeat-associated core domain-containing protein n=1 Tax=Zooshikella sp. RANM57 TaxID=3425863 RepID=UPI003D6FB2FE